MEALTLGVAMASARAFSTLASPHATCLGRSCSPLSLNSSTHLRRQTLNSNLLAVDNTSISLLNALGTRAALNQSHHSGSHTQYVYGKQSLICRGSCVIW
ncbi:hypothetical protein M378DRAFT_19145 [Amanita muscaria Koide BX008]|uniref:Uncharacterized protein n=1 Tax=Amanita muscaria (strain Koide BX008) TaxID=946122 RepID=A0A0C2WC75_AMAMK|nr:hypothetical protein M378DRAFT_19267 [Amanita muscaria Koide BX008]KIL54181.1 hypothetical protein M378DRAFT_19145 [Amanita muscaria Koide BX008]